MRESLSDEEQQIHSDAYMQEAAFDLDAVLDDIESTLEENAEEYVSSFVQKGGQ
ncbi:ubiquitin-like protein Pup [Alloscardovia omnicolens]|uniref:ubiquitin-like protein Pup n=1 Tax=Alloscardovia omnicolens TaxID=419015 RepID=UPI003A711390